MKPKYIILTTIFLSSTVSGWSLTGRDVMLRNRQLPKPVTSKGTIKLVVRNNMRDSEKIFQILTKRVGNTTQSRINFLRPTTMQFLIHSRDNGGTDQWIKLSSGRIRQIASGSRQSRWANSHFYYEDLRTYSLHKFHFRLLSDATVLSYKKAAIPCYRVEALPVGGDAVYSKRILFVQKDSWKIRRVQFFERGRHTKTLSNYLFALFSGINTPRLVYMEPANNKNSYSYLLIQKMEFNRPLSDYNFRRSSF